jgi:hypothetical protein
MRSMSGVWRQHNRRAIDGTAIDDVPRLLARPLPERDSEQVARHDLPRVRQDARGHRWDFTETIADVAPEEWSGGAFHLE